MTAGLTRVYLETSVLLAFLAKEPERSNIVRSALQRAQTPGSKFQLWTSPLAIVEITHLKDSNMNLDQKSFETINRFWQTAPIEVIEFGEEAGTIARNHLQQRLSIPVGPLPKAKKRSMDISHLSIAQWMGVDQFWTYDDDFKKYGVDGISITSPTGQMSIFEGNV